MIVLSTAPGLLFLAEGFCAAVAGTASAAHTTEALPSANMISDRSFTFARMTTQHQCKNADPILSNMDVVYALPPDVP
jgi:hypothetical protein